MKTNQPLVSVIIPLYNSEEYIVGTIESVLNQTYKNVEIIVVDDGSTDGSFAVAKRYESEAVHVYHQSNQGAQVARNFGFSVSKGKYIQYLDSDDYLPPHKIEGQVVVLENRAEQTIAIGPVFVDRGGECKVWPMPEIYHDFDCGFDMLVNLWYYFTPSLCIGSYLTPRELVEKSGGWDESLLKNQDGDFFSRVLINARKVVFVENEGQVWRVRENSTSHKVSAAKTESVLRSYIKIADLMLSTEDSERVRHAIAVAFGSFVINDSDRKHGNLALIHLKKLGIKPYYRINSAYFKALEKVFHPQTAMALFKKIQKLRGKEVYFAE
ncbi:MAG: glycosyltransferase family 2 protein [Paludibacteraceae bacterium]|nr:glycosyltransferase family 2 protein [Paludibacteraceae bacterium]